MEKGQRKRKGRAEELQRKYNFLVRRLNVMLIQENIGQTTRFDESIMNQTYIVMKHRLILFRVLTVPTNCPCWYRTMLSASSRETGCILIIIPQRNPMVVISMISKSRSNPVQRRLFSGVGIELKSWRILCWRSRNFSKVAYTYHVI